MKTSFKDPDLTESVYVYDSAGRLTKEQLAAGRTAYFAYDRAGLVTRKALPGNVVVSYYSYDVAARLKQLENKQMAAGSVLLSYFAYAGRNQNGVPTWVRNEGGDSTYYEYDQLDRLTAEFRSPTTNYSNYYGYDLAGNRILKIDKTANQNVYYTYDTLNLLQKEWVKDVETTYFTYDASQRMATLKIPGGQSSYFTHDQRSQVKKIEFAKASSPDETREFGYSGGGERLSLKVGSGASQDHRLAWDGMKLVTEKNAADGGATDRRYRHNMSMLDWTGSALEGVFGGNQRAFAFDPVGTTRNLMIDFGGEIDQETWIRDLFGKLVTSSTPFGNSGKLQFLSPAMLDLGLGNVQINPVGPGCYLPRWGVPTVGVHSPFAVASRVPSLTELLVREMLGRWIVNWLFDKWGWTLIAQEGGPAQVVRPCGPDVTQWLYGEMMRNSRRDRIPAKNDLPWRLAIWAFMVRAGGPWDFKASQAFVTAGCPVRPGGCNLTVTIAGICFNYDVPGNIHFGFVGRRWRFLPNMLRLGASAASLGDIGGAEPEDDAAAVELGMKLAEKSFPSLADFIALVKQEHANLNKRNTENCTPCGEAYPPDGVPGPNPALRGGQGFPPPPPKKPVHPQPYPDRPSGHPPGTSQSPWFEDE